MSPSKRKSEEWTEFTGKSNKTGLNNGAKYYLGKGTTQRLQDNQHDV
jgi:hypothetical protein